MCVPIYLFNNVCMYVQYMRTYVRTYVYIYICMYVCTYACVYIVCVLGTCRIINLELLSQYGSQAWRLHNE